MTRICVFGGSFDPVHLGHLEMARLALEQEGLDRLLLVPAAIQPHKPHGARADAADRVAMLRLATPEVNGTNVDLREIEAGGKSFTVDTLASLGKEHPKAELFLLLGEDSWQDFPTWRDPAEICRLATLLVVARPDTAAPSTDSGATSFDPADELGCRVRKLPFTVPAVSSREIRQRIAIGQSIRGMTLPAVADYIEARGLYRDQS